jgi:hypothetical protein
MPIFKKIYKKVFWPVFIVIFIITAVVAGKIIFDSVFPALSSGYKPKVILPQLSTVPKELAGGERYGYITSDEIWSGEIRVVGDIIVSKGATLTIKPGTTVLVAANSDKNNLVTIPFMLKKGTYKGEEFRDKYIHQGEPYEDEANHITIWIDGTLRAIGTKESRITIKSDSLNPGRYDWTRLRVKNGAIAYAEISGYRGLDLRKGTKITDSELHNSGGCLICINDSSDILIENNWLHDSNHEVMDIWNSSPTIINNKIGPSPRVKNPGGYDAGWGGIIVGSGFPIIRGNTIEGFNDAVSFFNQASYDALGENVLKENIFRNNIENTALNLSPD